MVIRSYRRVFEVDRRIYRVDRWALPVPGGVPLRAVGYFAATLLLVIVTGALPGVGALIADVSAPLRFVIAPLAVAVLATQAAPDGRAAHRFARRLAATAAAGATPQRGSGRAGRGRADHLVRRAGGALGRRGGAAASGPGRGPARATFMVPVSCVTVVAGRWWPSRALSAGAADAGAVRGHGAGGPSVSRFRCAMRIRTSWSATATHAPRCFAWTPCRIRFLLRPTNATGWAGWRGSRSPCRPILAVAGVRAYPADRYAEQAEPLLEPRTQSPAAWRSYLRGHEAHLRELRSFVPEVYLAISLRTDGATGVVRGADRIRRRLEALFGVAARGADPGGGGRGADRRGGASVPAGRGVPAAAARVDSRAPVAAASGGVPRGGRAAPSTTTGSRAR